MLRVAGILNVLLIVFYFSWAYNYTAIPLTEILGLKLVDPSLSEAKAKFESTSQKLNALSAQLGERSFPRFKQIEQIIRPVQEHLLNNWDIKTWGRVRVRKLPKGSLLINRTSGIYIPHAFEGHVDGGLYAMQWPFTLAHEMAHGYGITHESDCNFVGYLTCMQIPDPHFQYSGMLAYWRYQAFQMIKIDKPYYDSVRSELDTLIKLDLKNIREHVTKYPDVMPYLRPMVYDNYLKSHGVKEGLKSYDKMVLMINAYEAKSEPLIHENIY